MRRIWILPVFAALAAAMSIAIAGHAGEASKATAASTLTAMRLPPYAAQKVVYQAADGGGWFGQSFRRLIGSLENHVAAVKPGAADIRVVLQGKGLDLLRDPDATMRGRIDRLRAAGVRFVVCRNSLMQSGTEPSDLYGVAPTDVVRAGVAEIAALEAQGFVYLRP